MLKTPFALFLLAISCTYTVGYAQTVSLAKGQKMEMLTSTKTTINIEALGQNMQTDNVLTSEIETKEISDSGYLFLNTTRRMQSKTNVMGQSVELDSDRPEDLNSDAGGVFKKELGTVREFRVNKSGQLLSITNKNAEATPSMMDAFASLFGPGTRYPLLLVLPGKSVKEGDTWTDSTGSADSIKTVTSYTITSITGSDYLLATSTKMDLHAPIKQQGMEIKMDMSGTTKGTAVYEKSSCILKVSNGISEMKGTIGVMGQTAPMSVVSTYSLDVKKL